MALLAPDRLRQMIAEPEPDTCIIWPLGLFKDGAGKLRYGTKTWKAYRLAYLFHYGELPDYLRHTCDNRACCNPLHLITGTHLQNMHDMRRRNPDYRGGCLSAFQVQYILQSDKRNCDLARELGVDQSHISKIRSRQRRTL